MVASSPQVTSALSWCWLRKYSSFCPYSQDIERHLDV
ncbi:unnamed protein product [Choristocarpus tenellus]